MASNGTPERAAQRCGAEIARLRTLRNWSRAKLIARLYDVLEESDSTENGDYFSDGWLKRLENGQVVKVPRKIIEGLCRALNCTPRERAQVLLYADRSVFNRDDEEPDVTAEALTYAMDRIYVEALAILSDVIGQRRAKDLDEQELLELTATALELIIKQHRRR